MIRPGERRRAGDDATRLVAAGLASLVLACGGSAPAAQPPPGNGAMSGSIAPDAPLLVEYVVIHRRWVGKVMPAPAADVKAWSEAPENRHVVMGSFRHILIRAPKDATDAEAAPQRRRAQAILDRVKKGEDFATLAKQLSEDPGSRDYGGEYGAERVKDFVAPVRDAFDALKPGEVAPDLVRSKHGFHIVKKDRASEEQIERSYRRAKSAEATNKLAGELLARMRRGGSIRAAIAEAVEAVLGERASNDASRPHASIVARDRLGQVRLPAAAKAALETFAGGARSGDVLPSPAVDGDTVVVARALSPGATP